MNAAPSHPPFGGLREIRQALHKIGFRPNRLRGQSFLVDQNLLRIVADAGELTPHDVVLEIGTGTGALSGLLAERAGDLITVEVDDRLVGLASRNLAPFANVRLIAGSALDAGGAISAEVESALAQAMAGARQATYKLVANLPYSIATRVISLLLRKTAPVALMAVTVQREVANRLCAAPGTKNCGVLSVLIQATSQAEILRRIPPGAFWPQPEVDSALVKIRPDPERRPTTAGLTRLMELAETLFTHRRKTLCRSLVSTGRAADREGAAAILANCHIARERRPESLSLQEWLALAGHATFRHREDRF